MRYVIGLAAVVVILVSCGGGGGGGGEGGSFFGGSWTIRDLSTTENSCPFASGGLETFDDTGDHVGTFTVAQDSQRTILQTESGRVYQGARPSGGSVTVTHEETVSCTGGSQSTRVITLTLSGFDGHTATLEVIDDYSRCAGSPGTECRIDQIGTTDRTALP